MGMEEEMRDSHQVASERDQRDRQEEEWSIPASALEEGKTVQSGENHCIGPLLLLPPQRIDFLPIGVA